jgi:hypothetical protein
MSFGRATLDDEPPALVPAAFDPDELEFEEADGDEQAVRTVSGTTQRASAMKTVRA